MALPVVVGAGALSGALVLLWSSVGGDRRLSRRAARNLQAGFDLSAAPKAATLAVGDMARAHVLSAPASERVVVPAAERFVRIVRRYTPVGAVEKLNARISMAGMASRWPLERTLAAKFLLGGFGLFFGLLMMSSGSKIGLLYGLASPLVLFRAPDILLKMKADERQRSIRVALPDTLDQVTVCVEAGLAFEGALARAARTGTGPLADELVRTLQDVQLGVPRREALQRLMERNSAVEELRHFVQAVIQAEGYGVPIARVLRVQSAELREKRRQAAEERAMKVGIKMLFPLVVCILPTVFIVILGPAVFRLVDSLSSTSM
jgi:tight adherence protein C